MNPFLEQTAQVVIEHLQKNNGDITIIFPNRRSILFFNYYFKKKFLQQYDSLTIWMPECYTISDYIIRHSDYAEPDELYLIYQLYLVYCRVTQRQEPFSRFYFWGSVILSDFNEIDTYLIDPQQLFDNILLWKEPEKLFPLLTDDLKKSLGYFAWLFKEPGQELSDEQKVFVEIWKSLYKIYNQFNKLLKQNKVAYRGMILKETISTLEKNKNGSGTLFVIGLNVLNACEQAFLQHQVKIRETYFLWDFDDYYIHSGHEAGFFLRENLKLFEKNTILLKSDNITSKPPEIEIIASPSGIAQAAIVSHFLDGFYTNSNALSTGIVLCDESMLVPLLQGLPDKIQDINITMGFPLKGSLVYGFIRLMIMHQRKARIDNRQQTQFSRETITAILGHPFVSVMKERDQLFNFFINSGLTFFSVSDLDELKLTENASDLLFTKTPDFRNFNQWLKNIINQIIKQKPGTSERKLDDDLLYRVQLIINQVSDIFETFENEPDIELYFSILMQRLEAVRIPFEGEPLSGLQVMGLLESRNLDFEKVFILSANEGVIPRTADTPSLIPQSVRRAFGLPLHQHSDAMYGYYFYRLLHQSKQCIIVYHSSGDENHSGEPSRFVQQLNYEMNPAPSEKRVYFNLDFGRKIETNVRKQGYIAEKLQQFFDASNPRILSPSALKSYINCQVEFCYKYIFRLDQPDDKGVVDAAMFGRLLHAMMHELYKDLVNQFVTADQLNKLAGNHDAVHHALVQAVISEMEVNPAHIEAFCHGRNYIAFEILKKYARQVILTDARKYAPMQLIATESKMTAVVPVHINKTLSQVLLNCRFDRIDRPAELKTGIRIVDYKTGDENLKFKENDAFNDYITFTEHNAAFQLLCYSFVYEHNYPGTDIHPVIYQVKTLHQHGATSIQVGKNENPTYREIAPSFTEALQQLVNDIFDTGKPFIATNDLKKCERCSFSHLCLR